MSNQTNIKFEVGDQVLVLLVTGGVEFVEQATIAGLAADYLVLHLVERGGDCYMPVHKRYVLHRCSECHQEPTLLASEVCGPCQYDDRESQAWLRQTTQVYRFRTVSPYLQTERPVRGAA